MICFRHILAALTIAAALQASSCGGKAKNKGGDVETADAAPEAPPPLRKLLHLGLEYIVIDPDAEPPLSRVSLIFTDETGASRREVIGEFQGGCSDVSPAARAEAMKPILGLDCWSGEQGVKLRFVHRQKKLYVVSAEVNQSGAEPEFQPLKTINLPVDGVVTTDYDASK